MASRFYDLHRSRVHRPTFITPKVGVGLGWQELRREFIRLYCGESNVRTKVGREQCDKVCGDHFCCFERATDGYSCQYDESTTCEADFACRNLLVGPLDDHEETDIRERSSVLTPATLAGVNLPPVDFGEVPSPPLGDNFGVQQLRAWFDEKKEEERVILKGSLILMELEEETGGEVGVVRKSLTRTYDPAYPRTTCYDPLYQSDENGDAILQKTEYTKFITDLSEGVVDPENYLDFSFAFKVNFIYLSCQCKFHSNPSLHGGEECCLGPDAGIHISGAGPHEVPTNEEEAHLQLVCLTAQGTIDYERGPVPDTALPTYSPVTYSPTKQPEKLVSDSPTFHPATLVSVSPTKYPSAKPTTYFISSDQPATIEVPTPSPIKTRISRSANPTQTDVQFPSSASYLWRPPTIASAEPSQPSEANDVTAGDTGDAESGTTPGVVIGVILCVIIFGLYTVLSLVGKLKKDDDNEEGFFRDRREVSSREADSEADSKENTDIQDIEVLQVPCESSLQAQRDYDDSDPDLEADHEDTDKERNVASEVSDAVSDSPSSPVSKTPIIVEDPILPNKINQSFGSLESSGFGESISSSSARLSEKDPQPDDELKNEPIIMNLESFMPTHLPAQREHNDLGPALEVTQDENTEIVCNRASTSGMPASIDDPILSSKRCHSFNSNDGYHSTRAVGLSSGSCDDCHSVRATSLSLDDDLHNARASVLSFGASLFEPAAEADDVSSQSDGQFAAVDGTVEELADFRLSHIPLKIRSSQPDSQPIAGNVTKDDLIAAIEAGGWVDRGAVAAQLADSNCTSIDNAPSREPFVSFVSDTDTERGAPASNEMVMRIDWKSVVLAAAQFERGQNDGQAHTPLNGESQSQTAEAENLVRRVVLDEIVLWLRRRCSLNID